MDEKKAYSIIGQVTIGTDEYRDLIEAVADAEKQKDYYRDQYWAEQSITKNLTEENGKLKDKLTIFTMFLSENTTIKADFDNFKVRKQLEREE